MSKQNAPQTKPDAPAQVDTTEELEQANASLAERVAELEALLAAGAEREAQAARDVQSWRSAQITSEAERAGAAARVDALTEHLAAAERQLDEARRDRENLLQDIQRLDARRGSGAPLALDITALLELHRIVGSDSDRYLATARRLGDALVAQLASDPG